MTKVQRFANPSCLAEALAAKRADPSASYLAGGTLLLAGDGRDKPAVVIDIGDCLPRDIVRKDGILGIGACATFQEIAESKETPACIFEAAISMVNRNTRNRATLGGNLCGDKSCSSMLPILIALEAEVEVVSPSSPKPRLIGLESWLQLRAESAEFAYASDLILRVYVSLKEGRHAAYRRWNRVSCDLSILGAAAAYEFEGEIFRNVRLALGGFGPKARRFPAIESLFEGKPLLAREAIEEAVSPLLDPIGDLRASAAFKRLRGAQLVADALGDAFAMPEISEARA